jgi:hypothetical protein
VVGSSSCNSHTVVLKHSNMTIIMDYNIILVGNLTCRKIKEDIDFIRFEPYR